MEGVLSSGIRRGVYLIPNMSTRFKPVNHSLKKYVDGGMSYLNDNYVGHGMRAIIKDYLDNNG